MPPPLPPVGENKTAVVRRVFPELFALLGQLRSPLPKGSKAFRRGDSVTPPKFTPGSALLLLKLLEIVAGSLKVTALWYCFSNFRAPIPGQTADSYDSNIDTSRIHNKQRERCRSKSTAVVLRINAPGAIVVVSDLGISYYSTFRCHNPDGPKPPILVVRSIPWYKLLRSSFSKTLGATTLTTGDMTGNSYEPLLVLYIRRTKNT